MYLAYTDNKTGIRGVKLKVYREEINTNYTQYLYSTLPFSYDYLKYQRNDYCKPAVKLVTCHDLEVRPSADIKPNIISLIQAQWMGNHSKHLKNPESFILNGCGFFESNSLLNIKKILKTAWDFVYVLITTLPISSLFDTERKRLEQSADQYIVKIVIFCKEKLQLRIKI
ncbi:hypothetical protein BDA99DRAFT_535467 [Phascolomyces articulosus]|uniref:Uncharacterized protein n=1 Tax=Phascolomyces articulosus TaxID=60185 RepID=A0AAD5K3N6_9FUNG|nr:hypothetical protein BDA99DRAFT_535467 [Phascolomyces articulosus]